MVLEKNLFVEALLPGLILRELGTAEMSLYRRPFLSADEARPPMLTWPRQIPLDGEPAEVVDIAQAYANWPESGCHGAQAVRDRRAWRCAHRRGQRVLPSVAQSD